MGDMPVILIISSIICCILAYIEFLIIRRIAIKREINKHKAEIDKKINNILNDIKQLEKCDKDDCDNEQKEKDNG